VNGPRFTFLLLQRAVSLWSAFRIQLPRLLTSFTVSASFNLPFQHEYNGRTKYTTVLTKTEKRVTGLLKKNDVNYCLRLKPYRAGTYSIPVIKTIQFLQHGEMVCLFQGTIRNINSHRGKKFWTFNVVSQVATGSWRVYCPIFWQKESYSSPRPRYFCKCPDFPFLF
jgi:hypothetical protein